MNVGFLFLLFWANVIVFLALKSGEKDFYKFFKFV